MSEGRRVRRPENHRVKEGVIGPDRGSEVYKVRGPCGPYWRCGVVVRLLGTHSINKLDSYVGFLCALKVAYLFEVLLCLILSCFVMA